MGKRQAAGGIIDDEAWVGELAFVEGLGAHGRIRVQLEYAVSAVLAAAHDPVHLYPGLVS